MVAAETTAAEAEAAAADEMAAAAAVETTAAETAADAANETANKTAGSVSTRHLPCPASTKLHLNDWWHVATDCATDCMKHVECNILQGFTLCKAKCKKLLRI